MLQNLLDWVVTKKTHKLKLSEQIKISSCYKTQKLNDNKIKNLNCKNTKKLELGQSSTRRFTNF